MFFNLHLHHVIFRTINFLLITVMSDYTTGSQTFLVLDDEMLAVIEREQSHYFANGIMVQFQTASRRRLRHLVVHNTSESNG